eukprot:3091587-Rhodomonas_salina.1
MPMPLRSQPAGLSVSVCVNPQRAQAGLTGARKLLFSPACSASGVRIGARSGVHSADTITGITKQLVLLLSRHESRMHCQFTERNLSLHMAVHPRLAAHSALQQIRT